MHQSAISRNPRSCCVRAVLQRQRNLEEKISAPFENDDKSRKSSFPLFDFISSTDEYKETSRLYRRTIFNEQDWIRFRSSGRLFDNIATMFTSGVIRGLWLEIGSVSLVSTLIYLTNTAILSGALEPTIRASESSMLSHEKMMFAASLLSARPRANQLPHEKAMFAATLALLLLRCGRRVI